MDLAKGARVFDLVTGTKLITVVMHAVVRCSLVKMSRRALAKGRFGFSGRAERIKAFRLAQSEESFCRPR